MDNTGKWLVRGGALLVLLGYVLPTMTVSCGGFMSVGQSFSLAQVASQANQPLLYLVPAGMIVTIILAFLPPENSARSMQFFWAQVAGLVVSLISIIVAGLSLYSQITQYGVLDVSPEIGAFVLLVGYASTIVGLIMARCREKYSAFQPASHPSYFQENRPMISPLQLADIPPRQIIQSRPHLELIRGEAATRIIYIEGDDLTVGRRSENDLQLADNNVSRFHARLRYAQGAWFIQDQDSRGGTYINGQRVQAKRLDDGDEVTIGNATFIFRL
jgi:hypothetical protein